MNNEKRWGCLGAIIAFCFIGGNIFLFTGMKDLEKNPIAWLMLLFAIIVDAVAIGFIINWIIKHNVKKDDSTNNNTDFYIRNSTINSSKEMPKSFHTYSLDEKSTVLHVGDMVEKEHRSNRVDKIEENYLSSNETDDRSNDLTQEYFESAVKSEIEDNSKKEIAFWHNTEQQDLQLERYNLASCLSVLYQSRVEKEVLMKRLYVDLLKIIDMKHRADEKYSSEINNNTQSNSSIVAPTWVKVGVQVWHHIYGKGTVKSIEGKTAIIAFRSLIKEYAFPDAFIQGILKQVKADNEQAFIPNQKLTEKVQLKSVDVDASKSDDDESTENAVTLDNSSDTTGTNENSSVSWSQIDLLSDSNSSYKAQPITFKEKTTQKKKTGKPRINWSKVFVDIRNLGVKNYPPYPKGFYSKEFPSIDRQRAQEAYQFYQQALYIKNFTCAYQKVKNERYGRYQISTFSYIGLDDLKQYISWRTGFENGACAMEEKFFNLYINEIINHMRGFDKTKEHLQKIIAMIWDNYHLKYGKIHNAVWENNTLRFVEEYRDREYLLSEIKRFLIDYFVLSNYPVSAKEFNGMLPEQIRLASKSAEEPHSNVYSDSIELLDSVSDYQFLDKAFYKSDYGYLLPQAIDFVFAEIEKYLKAKRINWNQAVFHTKEKNTKDWVPFSNFVYYPGERLDDKSVELVNGDTYVIKNGKCFRKVLPNNPNPYSGVIGYTIKLIDNELRKALGFRTKLQTNKDSVTWSLQRFQDSKLKKKYEKKLIIFTTEEYEELVKNATNKFFDNTGIDRLIMSAGYKKRKEAEKRKAEKAKEQEKKKAERARKKLLEKIALETGQSVADVILDPVVVEFDRSKFDDIRKKSEEIQSVLIIEEEATLGESFKYVEEINEIPVAQKKNTEYEDSYDNEFSLLVHNLSDLEKNVLSQIIDGNSAQCISSYLIQNNDTLESVTDRINQKSLDIIGDNLIELTDQLYIYEDYFDEIRIAMEERK